MNDPQEPMADHAVEYESIRSYREATDLMREYLARVAVTSAGVEVNYSGDTIRLGTPSSPHIRAPIYTHLNDLQGLLLGIASLIDKIAQACRKTIDLTKAGAGELEPELKGDARQRLAAAVAERASHLMALLRELEAASDGARPPYHPARLQRCREVMERHLGTGDPRIKVEYTVTRVL